MSGIKNNRISDQLMEYVIVGDGPAAICATPKILHRKVPGEKIGWIGPHFKVGDFGTTLSMGSSVPGNTAVESYQKVNRAIYNMIPQCMPSKDQETKFEITHLPPSASPSLKVAAVPLQHISDNLRKLVSATQGTVSNIQEMKNEFHLKVESADGNEILIRTKRIILAVGAEPKKLPLPKHVIEIAANDVFIQSKLKEYINKNKDIKTVIVFGSSHSAALATMHLLQEGLNVIQFMNKDYLFAMRQEGNTQFDNTGLKGDVANFTRKLLEGNVYRGKWTPYVDSRKEFIEAHLLQYPHVVTCVGYQPLNSLTINTLPLAAYSYNKHTTQIMDKQGRAISGMYGIGIAYPPEVKAATGEIELAVGVGKSWLVINELILSLWEKSCAITFSLEKNGMFKSRCNPQESHLSTQNSILSRL